MEGAKINLLTDLSYDSIQIFSCLCIVQHYTKSKFRLQKIYEKSLIPFIYDCQNKLINIQLKNYFKIIWKQLIYLSSHHKYKIEIM